MHATLIGSNDPVVCALLRAAGVTRVTSAAIADLAALARPSAQQPDLLVLDARSGTDLLQAVAPVTRQHPATPVLLLLPALDARMMLDAMRAGVNECLTEPLTRDDLVAAIARISPAVADARRGEVLAIVGAKGGVGATTVAVNVATMLGKLRPGRTLLIDLHLTYGDVGLFLGVETPRSVVNALENLYRLDGAYLAGLVTQTRAGLHVLPSSDQAAATETTAEQLRELIAIAASEYPLVVLDVPRTDRAALDALDAATSIVLVANQEVATVRNTVRMTHALQQRYGHDGVSVVMSRFDPGAEIARRDIEAAIGMPVRHVFPNDYAAALASLNKGHPLVLEHANTLTRAFSAFARSLAGEPGNEPAGGPGLLARLTGRRRPAHLVAGSQA